MRAGSNYALMMRGHERRFTQGTAFEYPSMMEGAAYAKRLTAAGNRVAYVLFARQIHGFVTMGKVIDEAGTAIAVCGGIASRIETRSMRSTARGVRRAFD